MRRRRKMRVKGGKEDCEEKGGGGEGEKVG